MERGEKCATALLISIAVRPHTVDGVEWEGMEAVEEKRGGETESLSSVLCTLYSVLCTLYSVLLCTLYNT